MNVYDIVQPQVNADGGQLQENIGTDKGEFKFELFCSHTSAFT